MTKGPRIDQTAFSETAEDNFWTSSTHAALSVPSFRWYVYFNLDSTCKAATYDVNSVRCVR